jgi:hypothetical protein
MQPGQRLVTRNAKFGSWKEGEQGIYKGLRNGQYIVDFHGRPIRYKSEEWVLREWKEEEPAPKYNPADFELRNGELVKPLAYAQYAPWEANKPMHGPGDWRPGVKLVYAGPVTQQLRPDDIGTYEGVHNHMHMVRVQRTGFVASYSASEDFAGPERVPLLAPSRRRGEA